MDLEFFFFKLGPAIQFIFQIGYIPQESDFKELTPELYESFSMKASEEDIKSFSGHKIYAILPDDQQVWNRMVDACGENLMILNEEEIEAFTGRQSYLTSVVRKATKTSRPCLTNLFTWPDTSLRIYRRHSICYLQQRQEVSLTRQAIINRPFQNRHHENEVRRSYIFHGFEEMTYTTSFTFCLGLVL